MTTPQLFDMVIYGYPKSSHKYLGSIKAVRDTSNFFLIKQLQDRGTKNDGSPRHLAGSVWLVAKDLVYAVVDGSTRIPTTPEYDRNNPKNFEPSMKVEFLNAEGHRVIGRVVRVNKFTCTVLGDGAPKTVPVNPTSMIPFF